MCDIKMSTHFELSPIKEMELAASKLPGVISLAQGIPSFLTPGVIKEYVEQKLRAGVCDKYSLTTGLQELREEITNSLSTENLHYDPDQEIIVTAGSIEGITASIFACVEAPGDEIIMPSPTYASYQGAVSMARAKARFVPLEEDNNFDFHVEEIKQAITRRTRAILYCSPNNPTGTLYSEKKTRELVKIALDHNLKIIIDEVYKDFYYTDDSHFSAASIPEARGSVIRVCSFSKAYAMTGWRVGFLAADARLTSSILKFHDAMVTCAPVISQYAAIAALKFGEEALQDFKREFRRRRDYVINMLDRMNHALDYQIPKATYFVFPRIKDTVPLANESKKLAYDILRQAKVALVPGRAFGPSGEGHLRISYGREPWEIEEGMKRLGEYFGTSQKSYFIGNVQPVQSAAGEVFAFAASSTLAKHSLAFLAKTYLRRHKNLIVIGIAGTRGKTVFKRILLDLLSCNFKTRAGILSYNTELGLPLSVLNLEKPARGFKARSWFAHQALSKAFFGREDTEVLILEYGLRSEADAKNLLKIVKPQYLVISSLEKSDSETDYQSVLNGIGCLCDQVKKDGIFWVNDREYGAKNLGDFSFKTETSVALSDIGQGVLSASGEHYDFNREIVTASGKLATAASVLVARRLGMSREIISSYLKA